MARQKALITPEMLRWARESAGYDLRTAAAKLNRSVDELQAWESGEKQPTLPQARKAAELYRRPLAVFYLPGVPKDFQPPTLPDFRRLPEGVPADTPQLRLIIRLARERLEWAREVLRAEGRRPLRWVGSAGVEEDERELGKRIRKWLNITIDKQRNLESNADALRTWIGWVEERGAYVFETGGSTALRIEPEEGRGLALVDHIAPFIVLNAKDSQAGRLFTLVHELAHLWIGQPGISNREPIQQPRNDIQRIEVFCNRVAAEILIPATWMDESWDQPAARSNLSEHIEWHARQIHVSREAVARRAADLRRIPFQAYLELRRQYQDEWREHKGRELQSEGGPDWALMVPKRAGYAFTRLVLSAYRAGEITGRDVSGLLNTKLKHLGPIAEHAGVPDLGWGSTA